MQIFKRGRKASRFPAPRIFYRQVVVPDRKNPRGSRALNVGADIVAAKPDVRSVKPRFFKRESEKIRAWLSEHVLARSYYKLKFVVREQAVYAFGENRAGKADVAYNAASYAVRVYVIRRRERFNAPQDIFFYTFV